MAMREPTSTDECVYFTNRNTGKGKIKAWVFKGICPKCEKTGKVKMRAKEYICPECGYKVEQKEYEESLMASIKYICPYCGNEDEIEIPFKRKKVQILDETEMKKKTVDALRFICSKCRKNIDVTKKMK